MIPRYTIGGRPVCLQSEGWTIDTPPRAPTCTVDTTPAFIGSYEPWPLHVDLPVEDSMPFCRRGGVGLDATKEFSSGLAVAVGVGCALLGTGIAIAVAGVALQNGSRPASNTTLMGVGLMGAVVGSGAAALYLSRAAYDVGRANA